MNERLLLVAQPMEYAATVADMVLSHGYAGFVWEGKIILREPGDTTLDMVARLYPEDWAKAPSADQWERKGGLFYRVKDGKMYEYKTAKG